MLENTAVTRNSFSYNLSREKNYVSKTSHPCLAVIGWLKQCDKTSCKSHVVQPEDICCLQRKKKIQLHEGMIHIKIVRATRNNFLEKQVA